ncbi:MAG: ferredoxin reductase family protein, partial [Marmoricola sp.]
MPPASRDLVRAARFDDGVRAGSIVLLWGSLIWVGYLWAHGGGIQDLSGGSNALMSTGRLTGLVASDLLLAQVILIARLPILERAVGQDRLLQQHRVVGFTSFNLMVAHIVLITWAYAGGELSRTPATLWDLTVNYPGMLLAVAGTVCLVLTVTTSVKAARRRLRYESWHLLHLYAYLGVGLALPHQLWTGQDFLSSRAATVFWWGAWATSAGAILIWRVGLPLWRNLRHQLKVAAVEREADGTSSVYVTGRALHRFPAEAGQFLNWRFLGRPGWSRGNPYSLSAAPDGRFLRITVKDLGDNSSLIAHLRPGARVLVEGPYGRLTQRPRTRERLLFIGAGVGITPLRALVEGMDYRPGDATLLHRWSQEPLFGDEFASLAQRRGLQVIDLVGHRRSRSSWLPAGVPGEEDVTALRSLVPDVAHRDVYICGPKRWAEAARATALAAGTPATS